MREAFALTARYLTSALRRPGTRATAGLGALVVAAVLLSTHGSTRLTASLLIVAAFAFGAGAWAGGLLPADRAEGREAWLATLRPGPSLRRLAAAAAGVLLALGVATLGALGVGLGVGAASPESSVRAVEELPRPVGARLSAGGGELLVDLSASEAASTLELVVSPRYLRREATGEAARVRVRAGDRTDEASTLPRGAPLRVAVPAGATRVVVTNESPSIQLVVREARRLGARRSLLVSVLLAGGILGVGAGAIALVAVAVSRWTSGPTASAAGLVIALAGGLHVLVEDVTVVVGGRLEEAGLAVLGVAAYLAPDLRPLGAFTSPGAGYALEVSGCLRALAPVALYAVVALVLVVVPLPGAARVEERG